VTADEAGSVSDMNLVTRVNGKDMQASTGAQMIHSLDKVISYISEIMPLDPGDVIATGSPDGTGGSRNPTAFLVPGDQVEVEISGIGTLKNTVKVS
jgi:2-keto-4-pentenoate hydratase/2-oxohepta-3-ene-1,7-dioic acid hydratase in catechol pathway